jgi:4-methylaminobutanoate oxidase (formaldehyde-forming)
MGGWESNTIPAVVPLDFGKILLVITHIVDATLYTPNESRFEQHLISAAKRVPILENVGCKTIINGPIPVSADGEPILGRAPNVVNAFVGAGLTAGYSCSIPSVIE